ncbi:MAG: hypothetical protein BAJATHORv1_20299 [Candidatus Thorarchaeota archaeon]|nr:MAG: hypothetical protein BAJATHORv1_20299 [Candidatus Thorarchaeota archaeon]
MNIIGNYSHSINFFISVATYKYGYFPEQIAISKKDVKGVEPLHRTWTEVDRCPHLLSVSCFIEAASLVTEDW